MPGAAHAGGGTHTGVGTLLSCALTYTHFAASCASLDNHTYILTLVHGHVPALVCAHSHLHTLLPSRDQALKHQQPPFSVASSSLLWGASGKEFQRGGWLRSSLPSVHPGEPHARSQIQECSEHLNLLPGATCRPSPYLPTFLVTRNSLPPQKAA